MRICCRNCEYCVCKGRQQTQRGQLGRKKYFCKHPNAPSWPFVGFGDMTVDSPLKKVRTTLWCPKREANKNAAD